MAAVHVRPLLQEGMSSKGGSWRVCPPKAAAKSPCPTAHRKGSEGSCYMNESRIPPARIKFCNFLALISASPNETSILPA